MKKLLAVMVALLLLGLASTAFASGSSPPTNDIDVSNVVSHVMTTTLSNWLTNNIDITNVNFDMNLNCNRNVNLLDNTNLLGVEVNNFNVNVVDIGGGGGHGPY